MEAKLDTYIYRLRSQLLKKDIWLAMVMAICLIGVGLFLGWYNNLVVIKNPAPSAHYVSEPTNGLSYMSNWDGPNYLNIASNGYSSTTNANFFPLYPLLIRIVHFVIGSMLDSALVISWVCLVGACYYYLKIVKRIFNIKDKDGIEAARALLFFLLFPTSVFLIATYTESLFAFLALGSIYYALNKKYWLSAGFLAFCTATHITGLFVLLLVGMILLEQKAKLFRALQVVAIGSIGILSYMYYLWDKFRSPLGFINSQKDHGWLNASYHNLFSNMDAVNAIMIVLITTSVVYWWRRRRSFSVYSFLLLLIPIIGKQFGGFNRYMLMAFPAQLMLYGYLKDKRTLYTLALILSTMGWTYFLLQYAAGFVGG